MENIKIREISISNIDELSTVIIKTLIQSKDVQIFISEILFERLLRDNQNKIIWGEAVLDSFHYCYDVEKAFLFHFKDNNEIKTLQMHLVKNCSNYMQLTYFACKGIFYRHYLQGMEIILIINAD